MGVFRYSNNVCPVCLVLIGCPVSLAYCCACMHSATHSWMLCCFLSFFASFVNVTLAISHGMLQLLCKVVTRLDPDQDVAVLAEIS